MEITTPAPIMNASATRHAEPKLRKLRLRFSYPHGSSSTARDNFFFGVWHPDRPVVIEWDSSEQRDCISCRGSNWYLASADSPFHQPTRGLAHVEPTTSHAVAFRGYVLPSLHSYSPASEILRYWRNHAQDLHNGVFSAAIINSTDNTLTLMTDALGFGPLYYRRHGEAVIFATNPLYLSFPKDQPDLIAWRSLLETSWILGDRALSREITRIGPGQAICFSRQSVRPFAWFDFSRLPDGTRPAGPSAIRDVEDCFQQAMGRCLSLSVGSHVLPLSSGFDSRRILTGLVKHNVDYQALTSRVYQKEYRDLDATYAQAMAQEFGFAHTILETDTTASYVADDSTRRRLLAGESNEHTWAVRLMEALPNTPSLVFDGIGGDILGDPVGWKVHVKLEVAPSSPEDDISSIAEACLNDTLHSTLRADLWPSTTSLRAELTSYLTQFLPRKNIGELAFLLLRQRRTIAPWSQQLAPPGHVVVCPYFDLDYLRLLLSFDSVDKHGIKFQRACLRTYWPQFYKFPGNRDIPLDLPPGSPKLIQQRFLQCYLAMLREITPLHGKEYMRSLLTPQAGLLFECSIWSQRIAIRCLWKFHRLMELVWKDRSQQPCWEWIDS